MILKMEYNNIFILASKIIGCTIGGIVVIVGVLSTMRTFMIMSRTHRFYYNTIARTISLLCFIFTIGLFLKGLSWKIVILQLAMVSRMHKPFIPIMQIFIGGVLTVITWGYWIYYYIFFYTYSLDVIMNTFFMMILPFIFFTVTINTESKPITVEDPSFYGPRLPISVWIENLINLLAKMYE